MPVQDVVEDSAPTRHALRVDWFRREPGGGTIFVLPAKDENADLAPVAERTDAGGVMHD